MDAWGTDRRAEHLRLFLDAAARTGALRLVGRGEDDPPVRLLPTDFLVLDPNEDEREAIALTNSLLAVVHEHQADEDRAAGHHVARSRRTFMLLDEARERSAFGLAPDDLRLTDEEREDMHLANALLEVERDRLHRSWAALQRLLAAVPPGGTLDEVVHLPRPLAVAALRDTHALGWLRDAPNEDAA